MNNTSLTKIFLVSSSFETRSIFYENLYIYPDVIIKSPFQSPQSVDILIVTCTNTYGMKSGVPKDAQRYQRIFLILKSSILV